MLTSLRMKRWSFLLAAFFSLSSYAQPFADSLRQLLSKKMDLYLDKDGNAKESFLLTEKGIEVYTPQTDTSQRRFDFIVRWTDVDVFRNILIKMEPGEVYSLCRERNEPFSSEWKEKYKFNEKKKGGQESSASGQLTGICIALDPGHIAGDLETAKKEKKWVEMKNPPVQIIEGQLTLATALLLKKKLEMEGASVFMTRSTSGMSAFGMDYKTWKDSLFQSSLDKAWKRGDVTFEERNYLLTRANDLEIFRRFFLAEDVRERARKINVYQPDLTLVIHYNVDETNASWNKPSAKDYNMAFVGGSFSDEELVRPEDRIEFLRLLLTDEVERSSAFASQVVSRLEKRTGVPAALDSSAAYLKSHCLPTAFQGVFCRNLTLTRKIKGVVCYGESLYQDNVNECRQLSKTDFIRDGIKTSKRVEEVADAYFQAIMKYAESMNR